MTALTVAAPAPTSTLTGLGAVQPHVKAAAELIAAQGGITKVYGFRSYSAYDMGGHPAGLAVDFPCSKAQGDVMAAYCQANADALAIKYVIWQQRIWYPGKPWGAMSDRGSATANHMDHVHVSFKATGAGGGLLDKLRSGLGNLPGVGALLNATSDATSILNPATWGQELQTVLLRTLIVGAGAGLVLLGMNALTGRAAMGALNEAKEAIS